MTRDEFEKFLVGATVTQVDWEGVQVKKDGQLFYIGYEPDGWGGLEYRIGELEA